MSSRPGPLAVAVTVAAVVVLAAGALAARPHGQRAGSAAPDPWPTPATAGPADAQAYRAVGDPTAWQPTVPESPDGQPLVVGPSAPVPGVPVAGVPVVGVPVAGARAVSGEPARPRPDAPRSAAAWVEQMAAATNISPVAVRSYADATLALAAATPQCHLGWTTLAAVGSVESGHGTFGGSQLDAQGRAVPPILGPALDGVRFAAIPATARSTALHGDPSWDHAMGPMQVIPSTWWRWGADGDGDGVADPQDMDDAALAAALYLCAGGRDLATPDGWAAAVRSYNHSDAYVASVRQAADRFAALAG